MTHRVRLPRNRLSNLAGDRWRMLGYKTRWYASTLVEAESPRRQLPG